MGVFLKEKKVTVSSAGTAVQVDSTLKVPSVIITAGPNNSGTVYVGSSLTDSSTQLGQPLSANESLEIDPPSQFGTEEQIDLTKVYVDSTVSSDIVIVSYYVREGGSA